MPGWALPDDQRVRLGWLLLIASLLAAGAAVVLRRPLVARAARRLAGEPRAFRRPAADVAALRTIGDGLLPALALVPLLVIWGRAIRRSVTQRSGSSWR
ncbi:MAG: hypothetical protein U1E35_08365 [Rhodospirillales bacterium]